MRCSHVQLPGGGVAIACSRGLPRRKTCACGGATVTLCDWRLTGKKTGSTCSRALCTNCTTHPPSSAHPEGDPEKDLCPAHAESWAKHPKNPQNAGKGPRSSTCGSCSARIIWCRSSVSGKAMPVDEAPSADGNIVLDSTPMQPVATVLSGAELATARAARPDQHRLRTSHFATCPNARAHRKPKTPKETPTP